MKENTKFLWMYVGILFSFALILIVFAGLSQSSDAEEKKGLKNSIIKITEDNTELRKTNVSLQEQVTSLTQQNEALVKQINEDPKTMIDAILLEAVKAKEVGDDERLQEIIATIDPTGLTELQQYIYNGLVE